MFISARTMVAPQAQASAAQPVAKELKTIRLPVKKLTVESFKPYGQVFSSLKEDQDASMNDMDDAGCMQTVARPLLLSFAQVISATADGKEFDHEDAQLQLDQGTPRSAADRL